MNFTHWESEEAVADFLNRISRKKMNIKKFKKDKNMALKVWEVRSRFMLDLHLKEGPGAYGRRTFPTRISRCGLNDYSTTCLKDWWAKMFHGERSWYWLPRGKQQSTTYRTNMVKKNISTAYQIICKELDAKQMWVLPPFHTPIGCFPATDPAGAKI